MNVSALFSQVYDTSDDILLNTMIEFIGIYCDQPIVKDEMEQTRYEIDFESDADLCFAVRNSVIHFQQHEQFIVFNTRNSRISILFCTINLASNLIKVDCPQPSPLSLCTKNVRLVSTARQSILSLFECIFPNDQLVCEYLLLHLLSRVYVRQPSLAYGKLSLNISKVSDEQCAALEQLLQTLLPLHSRLSITVKALNTMQLMPNKNVIKDDENSNNQLMQTPLQLPFNSHLLIDERQMECGQLMTLGRSTGIVDPIISQSIVFQV
jgi:hypothetical protein